MDLHSLQGDKAISLSVITGAERNLWKTKSTGFGKWSVFLLRVFPLNPTKSLYFPWLECESTSPQSLQLKNAYYNCSHAYAI